MKKSLRILALVLACVFLAGASVLAAGSSYTKDLTVSYVGVNLVVDGIPIVPKDVKGNIVEPFIYEGTTYLPVRAVGEALGKSVSWDGATKAVYIGNVPGADIYLLDVCPPYEQTGFKTPNEFLMMGEKYRNGFQLRQGSNTYAIFNLNGEYEYLEFDFGHVDDTVMSSAEFEFYLDGEYWDTLQGSSDMLVTHVTIPLNHALQLKIESKASFGSSSIWYGFANAILK